MSAVARTSRLGPMGAGAPANLPARLSRDEARNYAGDLWSEDKSFERRFSNLTEPKMLSRELALELWDKREQRIHWALEAGGVARRDEERSAARRGRKTGTAGR